MAARVETRWDDHGWVNVILEGILIEPRLPMDFDQGNSARFRTNLDEVVRKAYEQGERAGIDACKKRLSDVIDWIRD